MFHFLTVKILRKVLNIALPKVWLFIMSKAPRCTVCMRYYTKNAPLRLRRRNWIFILCNSMRVLQLLDTPLKDCFTLLKRYRTSNRTLLDVIYYPLSWNGSTVNEFSQSRPKLGRQLGDDVTRCSFVCRFCTVNCEFSSLSKVERVFFFLAPLKRR